MDIRLTRKQLQVGFANLNSADFDSAEIAANDFLDFLHNTKPINDIIAGLPENTIDIDEWAKSLYNTQLSLPRDKQERISFLLAVLERYKDDLLSIGYSFNAKLPYFSGQISDVRVWNKTREQSEIQASMNSRLRGNEAGLIGYWPLNGDTKNYADNQNVLSSGFDTGNLIGPEEWQAWQNNEVLNPLPESGPIPLSAPALTAAFTWFNQAKTKDINTLIQAPSSFGYPLPAALRGLLANRLLSFGEASISNVAHEIVDGVPGEISVDPAGIEEPRPENKHLRISGLVSYTSRQ